ncbi:hypothetical protein PHAVU_002G067600 [Phaseolus vulgaris]|uniref:RRM domain-containing protein n=1 Tax=Phaseolus vulgaris TaxID=3885 RepID=V7CJ56_PHAVU|nr:hypothetical protein PHAVU_002G067600g [Phaseolus vulgaris]ESW29403.1 hypothetical protein PHAVU_002G067600g [Phaseolus vulgaris]
MAGRAGWSEGLGRGRNGGQGFGRYGGPRNGNVFSTFFFSNFPHGFGERDMVKVFQKWATVKEVFISRRLNKWGRRFGFVRFLDVKNVARLEGELDKIYIGNRKLHVNIPKYRRFQAVTNREDRRHMESQKEVRAQPLLGEVVRGTQRRKGIWVEKNRNMTFAEVVIGTSKEGWKGLAINTHHDVPKWLANSFVGTLCAGMDFNKLEEEIVKGGLSMVKARFMGDNMVLLSPTKGGDLANLMKQNTGCSTEVLFLVTFPCSRRLEQ